MKPLVHPVVGLRLALVLGLVILALPTWALTARLVSEEATVVLRPDGKARLRYSLEWSARGGTMHGFYFEGEAFAPLWDAGGCWAELPDGTRSALSIKDLGSGKFEVLLAKGAGFTGLARYNLSYEGDFAAQQLIGRTSSAAGEGLVFFDWGPLWWEDALDYRALRLVLPVAVKAQVLSEEEKAALPTLSEKIVKEQNRIDWYGTRGEDGRFYLTGLFYQKDLPAQGTQRLQLYFPEGYLDLAAAKLALVEGKTAVRDEAEAAQENSAESRAAVEAETAAPSPPPGDHLDKGLRSKPLAATLILIIAAALLLYTLHLRSLRAKKALRAGMSWAGDAWSPPKIPVGFYQVPGKVAEGLQPLEVALLMELPPPRVAAIVVEGLRLQGLIEFVAESPLQIKILSAAKATSQDEEAFLAAFDAEGQVLPGLMADFFETAIKKLQEKIGDCDLKATKAHYRHEIEKAEAAAEKLAPPSG